MPRKQLLVLEKKYIVLPETQEGEHAVNLVSILREEHNFSPAKARAYLRMLEMHAEEQHQKRDPGSIVYLPSLTRTPGKALSVCTLVSVELSYLHPEDYELINPDSTSELEWRRILRYTTEAKAQGAYLSQPDLAYLLGVHPSVIQ